LGRGRARGIVGREYNTVCGFFHSFLREARRYRSGLGGAFSGFFVGVIRRESRDGVAGVIVFGFFGDFTVRRINRGEVMFVYVR
jgi:hypothetical protein